MSQEEVIAVHKVPVEELCNKFGTHLERGLTDRQARDSLYKYGANKLLFSRRDPEWVTFLESCFEGSGFYMWIGVFLCFLLSFITSLELISLGVIVAVVLIITGYLPYNEEYEMLKEGFFKDVPQYAIVKRDGEKVQVYAEELTLGDIVYMRDEDKVPADLRVIEASEDFAVDVSGLTGESGPQGRSPNFTSENPLETANLIFYTTKVTSGSCTGIVVNIGQDTVYGQIAGLSSIFGAVPMRETTFYIHIAVGVVALLYTLSQIIFS